MGAVWLLTYTYVGWVLYKVDKPPVFLVKMWVFFFLLCLIFLAIYISIVIKFTDPIYLNVLIILCDIAYSLGHWLLSW